MNVGTIARICHQVNRAYCQSFGDGSQPDWDDAPTWQRESAVAGVKFHLDNPLATPRDSHTSWFRHKVAEGWIYGEHKDEKAKTHPCLVDYDELPVGQRSKDFIFMALVDELRRAPGA